MTQRLNNMIQVTLFIPLVLSGVASALWRERRRKQKHLTLVPDFPELTLLDGEESSTDISKKLVVIDDATEIAHNQRISLFALALSGSGALAFPFFTLLSIPLLSYSTFYFVNTIRRSNARQKKSAFTLFELASIAGTLITGRYLLLSSLLALSFSTRKWALQAGNISSIGMGRAFDPSFRRVWVLRNDAEVEINLSEIQPTDIAVLHTGDIIGKNGVVAEGEGIVKQFALTGALQVLPKQEGDSVFAHTELVAGDLFIRYI